MNFENPGKNNENREKTALVESLKTGFGQKAELILALSGEKPATILTVFTDTAEEIPAEEEKVKKIGLRFKKVDQKERAGRYMTKFLIAGSEDNLNELAEADPSVDHAKFGALMGYPPSAVRAFSEAKLMDIDEERELLQKYPEIVFHNFRLSKDGKEEEIKVLKRWNDVIKKAAPNLL